MPGEGKNWNQKNSEVLKKDYLKGVWNGQSQNLAGEFVGKSARDM